MYLSAVVENTVEDQDEDAVTSRVETRNNDASIHPIPTVAVAVAMNAKKNADTESNTYRDERKVLDYERTVALTGFDKRKRFRSHE